MCHPLALFAALCLIFLSPLPARAQQPRTVPGVLGTLTKLDDKSLTITLPRDPKELTNTAPRDAKAKDQEEEKEPEVLTFSLDEKTRVMLPRIAGEREGPRGQIIRTVRFVPGKLADLKVGQSVMIVDKQGLATDVRVMIPLVVPKEKP